MKRRKFIQACTFAGLGIPLAGVALTSCESLYYASFKRDVNKLIIPKSEFQFQKKEKTRNRSFVLLENSQDFPICVYKVDDDRFVASLMKCTHQGCELNVAGGTYNCPCHGSEFSMTGIVLEGPADENLKTFETQTNNENVYVALS